MILYEAGLLPRRKGKKMKNYKSIALYRGGLRITDLRNIVVEIIEFIIRNGLLIHDRGRPYLNCGSYY